MQDTTIYSAAQAGTHVQTANNPSAWRDWPFPSVWTLDFEFSAPDGERPRPWCMVARELRSARELRVWLDCETRCPFDTERDLFVAYFASAEVGCFLVLGWSLPAHVVDLYAEHRVATNGLPVGNGLLDAARLRGFDTLADAEKSRWREVAIRGAPFSDEERAGLLIYCASDVHTTAALFERMAPAIDLPRALYRGRYMVEVARMEHAGIPVDRPTWVCLVARWSAIRMRLVREGDAAGVYEGESFRVAAFERWLAREGIPWPRLPSGALALDRDTFREMAMSYPPVLPLKELRSTLSELRLNKLAVGADARNRCLLSPYRTKTGRNAPSGSRFVFGPSVWIRGLVQPAPGRALAYVDFGQQEFAIGAALSGDETMRRAYTSGDPCLGFAIEAGAVPRGATKKSHPVERARFKTAILATQYQAGAELLASRLGESPAHAKALLDLHRRTFAKFWTWNTALVTHGLLGGELHTVYGWRYRPFGELNPRSLGNWPIQSTGAEILRCAAIRAFEAGVSVVAPVHDALLIEASAAEIDDAVAACRTAMADASRVVLGGFEVGTDAQVLRHPERLHTGEMWDRVTRIATEVEP